MVIITNFFINFINFQVKKINSKKLINLLHFMGMFLLVNLIMRYKMKNKTKFSTQSFLSL